MKTKDTLYLERQGVVLRCQSNPLPGQSVEHLPQSSLHRNYIITSYVPRLQTKFGITHNWKFYYITIRPAVLVWNTTTPLKTACESIQVQAVPWSTHHHTFVMSEFVSLLSSIHTIAPPCMLNWWVRCCAWTATNCHLLDPAVIAEGRAHSLARKNTKFAEFFLHRLFKGTHTFSNLSTKIDQQRRLDATGTYVDLVWCQQERLAHLCRGRTNTSHVPTLHLRQRWKVPTTHITFFNCSCHLRLQP